MPLILHHNPSIALWTMLSNVIHEACALVLLADKHYLHHGLLPFFTRRLVFKDDPCCAIKSIFRRLEHHGSRPLHLFPYQFYGRFSVIHEISISSRTASRIVCFVFPLAILFLFWILHDSLSRSTNFVPYMLNWTASFTRFFAVVLY